MRNMNLHIETPVFESLPMGESTDKSVFLKMECFQPVGSFKIRGIGSLCKEYVASGKSHLISSSGGNAGFAVAYAGRKLGAEVTVVVPETTSREICHQIEREGAKVEIHGSVWDESHNYALELSRKLNGAYISPFDHPTIWRGHSTIVNELVGQCERPDVLILSVGGGGLLCGIAEGLHRNNWHNVPIVAVETKGASSLAASIAAGKLVTLERIDTIATTLGAKRVATRAFEYTKTHAIVPFTVTDKDAIDACLRFSRDHRILVEPACGAALSVVYQNADIVKAARSILIVVCGGIGVSIERLLDWQKENLTNRSS